MSGDGEKETKGSVDTLKREEGCLEVKECSSTLKSSQMLAMPLTQLERQKSGSVSKLFGGAGSEDETSLSFKEFVEACFPMIDEEDVQTFSAAYDELDKKNRDLVPGVLMPMHLLGLINFFLFYYSD